MRGKGNMRVVALLYRQKRCLRWFLRPGNKSELAVVVVIPAIGMLDQLIQGHARSDSHQLQEALAGSPSLVP